MTHLVKRLLNTWSRIVFIFILFIGPSDHEIQAQESHPEQFGLTHQFTQEVFPLVHSAKAASVFIDAMDAEVVNIAAQYLTKDIERITGVKPALHKSNDEDITDYPVIIGTIGQSALIDGLADKKKLEISEIQGKWESFSIAVVEEPFENVEKALVIAGSDRRGTAFGVFEFSRLLGVSPWHWWADVEPENQENLYLSPGAIVQGPPSVKYRGIFLNDEDWGLQPWAARNIDKDIKDIGPNTYSRIFELLLRLKANLIWPAMHPSTKAFFHYPGNPEKAKDYAIVVGTSHAEPMLRNNVDEWDEHTMGNFDYIGNQEAVQDYWEKRVKESKDLEAIYTTGMRGVHDSGMKGVNSTSEAAAVLERIIADQRGMLKKYINSDVEAVPQAFTAYKEVLGIYDQGMELPEDITIVWPDDNYGYIRRLSSGEEQERSGGSGVYYHASYWGRPHDYLWLSTTHPGLIREEMMKAYTLENDRLWVLNVGDIKPLEYNIELFLDMAYDASDFQESSYLEAHLEQWVKGVFGEEYAGQISDILWEYYDLAFERKPEFMGWSRTEPTTQTKLTEYNHFYFGDEAQERINSYETLEQQVKELRGQIDEEDKDAFYQLVYYPVLGSSLMNKKFLYRDKSYWYTKQNRISAKNYAELAMEAYDEIVEETDFYNNQLANGKWNGMMSMKPRGLPVYQEPEIPEIEISVLKSWGVAPEGFVTKDSSLVADGTMALPEFNPWGSEKYFIDLYLSDNHPVSWEARASEPWIELSEQQGNLSNGFEQNQQRIWVSVDWNEVPQRKEAEGTITLSGGGESFDVEVKLSQPGNADLAAFEGFVENNGFISIFAENHSRKTDKQNKEWSLVENFGHTGKSLMALPLKVPAVEETVDVKANSPFVEYDFYIHSDAAPSVIVSTLPTHPVTKDHSMRYGISIDGGPVEVVDFRTFGRSEEWKKNVLENRAARKVNFDKISRGKHTLKIYMVDPGVILDSILIDLGGLKKAYSTIPETKNEKNNELSER